MWTSTEGKPLLGKLIAFEDLVAEAPKGAAAPAMPSAPDKLTVTRGDKIRLLVNQKPVEVGMERLCTQDREFVAQIEAAVAKKAAAPEPRRSRAGAVPEPCRSRAGAAPEPCRSRDVAQFRSAWSSQVFFARGVAGPL
jgi:hypothetical protein